MKWNADWNWRGTLSRFEWMEHTLTRSQIVSALKMNICSLSLWMDAVIIIIIDGMDDDESMRTLTEWKRTRFQFDSISIHLISISISLHLIFCVLSWFDLYSFSLRISPSFNVESGTDHYPSIDPSTSYNHWVTASNFKVSSSLKLILAHFEKAILAQWTWNEILTHWINE